MAQTGTYLVRINSKLVCEHLGVPECGLGSALCGSSSEMLENKLLEIILPLYLVILTPIIFIYIYIIQQYLLLKMAYKKCLLQLPSGSCPFDFSGNRHGL